MSRGPHSVALVMIARNEARGIQRALASVRPFVDRLLVLDTGSTDDTVALARQAGADVHRFDWCDDFSAARNRALDLADADWHLIVDADEWLIEGGEQVAALRHQAPDHLGQLGIRSEFGADSQVHVSWLTRVLPRGVRYSGRIHEQPDSDLPRVRLGITLGHDGYTPAQLALKRGRNRTLLLAERDAHPDDPHVWLHLGKDHETYGEHAEAAACYRQAWQRSPQGAPWRHDLIVRLLHCLGQSGALDEALVLAGNAMDEWDGSPDYHFVLGNLLLNWATRHPEQAMDQGLPMARAAWERCLQIGERPDLDGSVSGRGSHLAAHNLAVIHDGLGQADQAAHYRQLAVQLRT
ncbi:MAG: glycosyltransferase family 2 protein [Hydrogenophaga sp.]|uniref:glycosyltransferase family 2 protein n=1 Tax=Hydrogenophaga sp. TaxID=1904254 RepID=UPI001DEDE99A|nr:glycosyltransferase family 2 protein [Hydrogenophaga sp.]MBX3609700.1 glycosyltransferase family 2 protein [Hydrogenophaga sp.]